MRLLIIPRNKLDEKYVIALTDSVEAPEHKFDNGSCKSWNVTSYFPNLYAVIELSSQMAIGILYESGPRTKIDVAWWIDSHYRNKGYASEAIDLFACHLKISGVTGVGNILIDTYQGKYHEASSKLAAKFKAHF